MNNWCKITKVKEQWIYLFFSRTVTLLNIIILLIPPIYSYGQTQDIRFRHLTIEDGLSQSTVNCILQDKYGFMWFGTQDGLNRFDGYQFIIYKNNARDANSLSDNYINCIWEDKTGILWIGTRGGGLNMFDPSTKKFVCFEEDPENSFTISHKEIRCIFEDHLGLLWIGTYGGGLNRFDREENKFIHYRNDPNDPNSLSDDHITCMCEDAEGVLWIGTDGGGINSFDCKNKRFIRHKNEPDDPYVLNSNNIHCMFVDRSGTLWIGTGDAGLGRFDREKRRFIHYQNDRKDPYSLSDNRVSAISEDQSGFLWIGTEGSGINRFDRVNGYFSRYKNEIDEPNSLCDNTIISLYEDSSGVIWIGTVGNGLNQILPTEKKYGLYHNTRNNQKVLMHNSIHAIYEDDEGFLWIGTRSGLTRMDPSRRKSTHFPADKENPFGLLGGNVFSICGDSDAKNKVLWISSFGEGLNRFNMSTGRSTHYVHDPKDPNSLSDNYIYFICKDYMGILWIGTRSGLNRFDPSRRTFKHYKNDPYDQESISDDYVHVVYEDRQKILWIGTGNGLNIFDRSEETFKRYQHDANNPYSLSNNRIYSICEDSDDGIWIGTQGGGLNRFDRKSAMFTFFTENEGLANNAIYGILEDEKDQLWISTNNGISRFDRKTSTFKNYDVSDGLQSNEFNTGAYFKSKTGEMFFGGINGFNSFYPDQIKDNLHVPPVVITDFKIFNKSIPIGRIPDGRILLKKVINETEEIRLSYRDRAFSFEFASLNYISPEKNRYAFKLEGLGEEWNYIGSRNFVSFTTLPPKTYTLLVKASNNDGIWNEEGASLKITITPPFWQTTWFRMITVLFLLFVILGLFELRAYSIKKRSKELEKRVKERTIELKNTNQELQDFAHIVSHDLKAPLRGVSQLADWIVKDNQEKLDDASTENLNLLQGRVKRMDNLIDGILQYSRAGRTQGEKTEVDLNVIVRNIIEDLAPPKHIQVEIENTLPVIQAEEVKIQQVFQNLISNAIKYMDKSQGKVQVGSAEKSGHWEFHISDNGPGIEKKYHETIFKIFQTLEARDQRESTGVGLSVVKKIVEKNGGKIWVESKAGEGSRFYFTLLRAEEESI